MRYNFIFTVINHVSFCSPFLGVCGLRNLRFAYLGSTDALRPDYTIHVFQLGENRGRICVVVFVDDN